MRKILDIALNDLRVFFKERGQIIGLIVTPLVFTIGVGLAGSNNGPSKVRVDVVDNEKSPTSQQFLADVKAANASLVLCPMDNDKDDTCQLGDSKTLDEAAVTKRVTNNDTLAAIIIPAGFGASVQAGDPAAVTYQSNENVSAQTYIRQAVQAAISKMATAQVAATIGSTIVGDTPNLTFKDDAEKQAFRQSIYQQASDAAGKNPISVTYTVSQSKDPTQVTGAQAGFGQSIPGMGSMFVMFTVFTSLYVLIRERVNWTLQRLVTMPLSKGQILAGKVLTWFVIGMIQYAVVFIVGLFVGVNFGHDLVALLLVMVIYTLSVTAFSFAISTVLKTEAQANSISLLLSLMLASLGGAWWSLDIVPPVMRTIGRLSPVAWAMDSYRSLLFENGNLINILPNLAVLVVFTVVCFAFAVWRFRYE